ncbi:Similar to streptomycin adenyltransferase [Mycobacteroides abscessus subsp. massiliense]|nr:Similar to streptomycin adenyltransferase [Mycobacteroides abscessus subsp. massiliense]
MVERLEDEDSGYPTRLIYYKGGKLDFTLIPAEDLATVEHDRPFRVLLDKDGGAPDPAAVATPHGERTTKSSRNVCTGAMPPH